MMKFNPDRLKEEVDFDQQRLLALTNLMRERVKNSFNEQDSFPGKAPVVGRDSFDPDELAQSTQIFLDKASQDDSADMGVINDMQSELDDALADEDTERLENLYLEAVARWPHIAATTGPTGVNNDPGKDFGNE